MVQGALHWRRLLRAALPRGRLRHHGNRQAAYTSNLSYICRSPAATQIYEAILSGIPVITTRGAPVTDFLSDETAWLIDVRRTLAYWAAVSLSVALVCVQAEMEACDMWPCGKNEVFADYNGG